MKKVEKVKSNMRFTVILLVGIIFSGLTIIGLVNNPDNQDIRSRAEEEDPNFCQNHCKPDAKRCDFNDTSRHEDDPNINDSCCEELAKTGDPMTCPWPQRGYCTDGQCAAIPEDVNRQRCGGPRHSWCNLCNEKCSGSNGVSPTLVPTVFISPTSIPTIIIPTVVIPTSISTQIPTSVLTFPTNIPTAPTYPTGFVEPTVYIPPTLYIYPTFTPVPTNIPTPTPKLFSLPNIFPPKEKVVTFFDNIKTYVGKFLSMILP